MIDPVWLHLMGVARVTERYARSVGKFDAANWWREWTYAAEQEGPAGPGLAVIEEQACREWGPGKLVVFDADCGKDTGPGRG